MKTSIIYTIIGLLAIHSMCGQVKIGDNPQNLNPASLLELESTSRALVITRVTDAQMGSISPLRGALVYNTDQNCLHYYDGTAWINICEALDDSFTTSTEDGTIVITQDGDNYDFSVGLIDSSNIPRNSIEGSDIAPGVIDSQHYANNSINPEEHFNGLASNTRQIIIWNGTDWVYTLESDLQISEADGVIGNEVVDVTDGTLTRSGNGDAGDPYTIGVSPLGITENELANNAVTSGKIRDGEIIDADISATAAILGTKINPNFGALNIATTGTLGAGNTTITGNLSTTGTATIGANTITNVDGTTGQVLTTDGTGNATWQDPSPTAVETTTAIDGNGLTGNPLDLADDAVTTDKILDANVTNTKLDKTNIPLSGFGAAGANVSMGNFQINDLLDPTLDTDAATKNYVDSQVGDISSLADASIYVGDINGEAQEVAISGDATMDNAGVLTIEQDAITTTKILDANVTRAKLENGTDTGQLMQWNGTDWVLIDAPTVSEGDGITVTPSGQEFNVAVTNPIIALGKINSDGSNDTGKLIGASINYNVVSPGEYEVVFDTARPTGDDNYIVQLTLIGAGPDFSIEITGTPSNTGFTIQTSRLSLTTGDPQTLNPVPTDAQWYFTVTNL